MSEDIRAGEVAVTLPDAFDAGIYFIGRIRTPWMRREDCPKNARGSDAVCTIDLDPRYAAALEGVATCTHLVLLYFMDRARRDLLVQSPRHGARKGTFALRSPVRPNGRRPRKPERRHLAKPSLCQRIQRGQCSAS